MQMEMDFSKHINFFACTGITFISNYSYKLLVVVSVVER